MVYELLKNEMNMVGGRGRFAGGLGTLCYCVLEANYFAAKGILNTEEDCYKYCCVTRAPVYTGWEWDQDAKECSEKH